MKAARYNRGGQADLYKMIESYMNGGKVTKYENGGSDRDMRRPGRTAVSYRTPSPEMLDRSGGFYEPIPMKPEQGGVLIPRELENMERMAVESKDPEIIAQYEAAMTEFMDSPEYKQDQEAILGRFQRAQGQYETAKTGYDQRKMNFDEMREGMRSIMNSRIR